MKIDYEALSIVHRDCQPLAANCGDGLLGKLMISQSVSLQRQLMALAGI
jgi:hypothetical protein